MAIIKSLAVGRAKGSAQDLTYTTIAGATIMKGKVAFPKNPKTVGQMARRVRWANLVNLWGAFNLRDRPSFEGRPDRVSDFNAFIGSNIAGVPVYLTKTESDQGATVVAAYQITRGSLPTIGVTAGTGGVKISDIELGALTIDGDTTLKDFSDAVILNNENYQHGDQITFFYARQAQNPNTGIPYVTILSDKVTLNQNDEDTLLSDIVEATGFTTVDGKLGMNTTITGGAAWVHTRIAADGSVLVSSQSFSVNNDSMLAQYSTSAKRIEAIISYGGKTTQDYLRPGTPMAPVGN